MNQSGECDNMSSNEPLFDKQQQEADKIRRDRFKSKVDLKKLLRGEPSEE